MAQFFINDEPTGLDAREVGRGYQLLGDHIVSTAMGTGAARPVKLLIPTAPRSEAFSATIGSIVSEDGKVAPDVDIDDIPSWIRPYVKGVPGDYSIDVLAALANLRALEFYKDALTQLPELALRRQMDIIPGN